MVRTSRHRLQPKGFSKGAVRNEAVLQAAEMVEGSMGAGYCGMLTVCNDNFGAGEQISELLSRLNVHCSGRHGKC